jgi:hypothetical protein
MSDNTGTKQVDAAKEFTGLGRAILIAMIISLRARLKELEGGICLSGWWCMHCDTFNSGEKEPLKDCRHCGREKATKQVPQCRY